MECGFGKKTGTTRRDTSAPPRRPTRHYLDLKVPLIHLKHTGSPLPARQEVLDVTRSPIRRPQNFSPFKQRQVLEEFRLVQKPFDSSPPKCEYVSVKEAMRNRDWTLKAKDSLTAELSKLINASNGLLVAPQRTGTYKFFLSKGNNSQVVKQCFHSRWWWTEVESFRNAHLAWTQFVSDAYMQTVPAATSVSITASKAPQSFECAVFFESLARVVRPVDISGLGFDLITKSDCYSVVHDPVAFQAFGIRLPNKLEFNSVLADKKCLFMNMKEYYTSLGEDVFEYLPMTFHFTGSDDPELQRFAQYCADLPNTVWIVKPGENANRGNGISVCKGFEGVQTALQENPYPATGDHTYVVQEYVLSPFLIHKRKFDIRCFLLVTSINRVVQAYFYEEGYLRTASKEYGSSDLSDKSIHLTNDAIQKKTAGYGKYESGNKLSYTDFQKYLDKKGVPVQFRDDVLPGIKAIAADTVKATWTKFDSSPRQHSFELFGLDFLLDYTLRPWLIEVNTNPCLETTSPILARIIPALLENVFKIAVDPLFPEPGVTPKRGSTCLLNSALQENHFELVFHQVLG